MPACHAAREMDTRERVRRRLEAFFQREDAPTQADAAKRLGMSQSGFSKLLARGPVLEHLDVLADIMGCTVADLVAPGSALTSAPVRDPSHPDAPDRGFDPALPGASANLSPDLPNKIPSVSPDLA
jgi:hypothetical protein